MMLPSTRIKELKMMLKILITVLLFSCTASIASEDFSEKTPHVRHTFSADISKFVKWNTDHRYSRSDQCWSATVDIFKAIGFEDIPIRHENNRMGCFDTDLVFIRDIPVFVHLEHSPRSRSLHLSPAECTTPDYKSCSHVTLSQAYVDNVVKFILDQKTDRIDLVKRAFEKMRTDGTVRRIGVVINDDYICSFYNVFENGREEGKGSAILKELADYFISSDSV